MLDALARGRVIAEAHLGERGRRVRERIVRTSCLRCAKILQRAGAVVSVHAIPAAEHPQLRLVRVHRDRGVEQAETTIAALLLFVRDRARDGEADRVAHAVLQRGHQELIGAIEVAAGVE